MRPALAEHGIRVVDCAGCSAEELERADRIFHEQIFPVLTPLAVGPGRPFPYISNLSLSIAVWLRDPVTDTELFARVKVPKEVVPRFIDLGDSTFLPLEAVIARHLDTLFPGMELLRHAASGWRATPTSRCPTRPTTCCAPWRTSFASAASARWCGWRWRRRSTPACARS